MIINADIFFKTIFGYFLFLQLSFENLTLWKAYLKSQKFPNDFALKLL